VFTDSRTPIFLMEKIKLLRGLDKKRIKIYEIILIVEKNLVGIMIRGSIYRYLSKKFDLTLQNFNCGAR
jgi:hypothetical protein